VPSLFNLPSKRKMVNYRRPQRKSIRSRKAKAPKRYYTPPRTRTLTGRTAPGRITGLSRSDYGFPDRLRTKLHYCDVINLASSAGTPGLWQFRMNSLFDPDYSGLGHQPQWYDQLSAVYSFYRVLGSKITVTFIPGNVSDTETNDKGPYICGITTVSASPTFSAATYASLLEDGNAISGVIVDKQGGNNKLTLTNTFSPQRDLGLDPMDENLRVATSSSPGNNYTVFSTLWCLDMQELAAQDVICKVEIEFQCEFSCRKENVNS